MFWPARDFKLNVICSESFGNGSDKSINEILTLLASALQAILHFIIMLSVQMFESQIFQFPFDGTESETMRKWRIDFHGFIGYSFSAFG